MIRQKKGIAPPFPSEKGKGHALSLLQEGDELMVLIPATFSTICEKKKAAVVRSSDRFPHKKGVVTPSIHRRIHE